MTCIQRTATFCSVLKALVTRCIFGLHGFVCIWRVTLVKHEQWYWALTGTLLLLFVETVYTLKKKKGGEWKWICPSVFLYLTSTLPAIWVLELDMLWKRIGYYEDGVEEPTEAEPEQISVFNGQFFIPIYLVPDDWVKILEQILLLLLIIGRWLLPKGEITREQLSQLLLVYIGMAADIIELFEAFKEKEVRFNVWLTIIILSLWTASLLQFTFVLSASKARKPRSLFEQSSGKSIDHHNGCICCEMESISILTTICLQDGPFLVLRMMLIFRFDVLSYTNIFFTAKNTLVNVLQFYRLIVLYFGRISCYTKHNDDSVLRLDDLLRSKGGANLLLGAINGSASADGCPGDITTDCDIEMNNAALLQRLIRRSSRASDNLTPTPPTTPSAVFAIGNKPLLVDETKSGRKRTGSATAVTVSQRSQNSSNRIEIKPSTLSKQDEIPEEMSDNDMDESEASDSDEPRPGLNASRKKDQKKKSLLKGAVKVTPNETKEKPPKKHSLTSFTKQKVLKPDSKAMIKIKIDKEKGESKKELKDKKTKLLLANKITTPNSSSDDSDAVITTRETKIKSAVLAAFSKRNLQPKNRKKSLAKTQPTKQEPMKTTDDTVQIHADEEGGNIVKAAVYKIDLQNKETTLIEPDNLNVQNEKVKQADDQAQQLLVAKDSEGKSPGSTDSQGMTQDIEEADALEEAGSTSGYKSEADDTRDNGTTMKDQMKEKGKHRKATRHQLIHQDELPETDDTIEECQDGSGKEKKMKNRKKLWLFRALVDRKSNESSREADESGDG